MLPKKNRLKLTGSSKEATEKVNGRDFIIKYKTTKGAFKAAAIISKSTAKRAVDRNRIKRLITTALRELGPKDLQLVIIVKKNIAQTKTEEVKNELAKLIAKI